MKNSGFSASKFCADKIRNIEIFERKDITVIKIFTGAAADIDNSLPQ